MAKFMGFMLWMLMMGVSHAAEIQDTPPTEPNYAGIIIFFVLMIGGGVWFLWKMMRNKGDDKK